MNKLNIPYNKDDKKYRLDGKISFQDIELHIENWKGSFREGTDPNGRKWRTIFNCPYGYIQNVKSSDGDFLDVFVGDNENSNRVFIVKQKNIKTGKFDEYKIMLGFNSLEEAKEMYFSNYDTKKQFDSIKEISMKKFKKKIGFGKNGVVNMNEKTFKSQQDEISFFIALEKAHIKQHTRKTKSGKLSTVKEHEDKRVGRKKKGSTLKNPWIKEFGHLKLNRFPDINVKKKDVKINMDGDLNSHAVLTWKDENTGNLIHAYTSEYMKKKKEEKYKRVEKLNPKKIEEIKKKSLKEMDNQRQRIAEAGAILYIVAETGLRVGSHRLFDTTGNKGLTTASPNDITIKGDLIKIKYRGKSYQDNEGELRNKKVADFLRDLKDKRKDNKFLFETDHAMVGWRLKVITKDRSLKTKDLRTYIATNMADNILSEIKLDEMPESKTAKKKIVKKTLNEVFDRVSKKLNNTSGMAKNHYVNPKVTEKWLKKYGLQNILSKSEMDEIIKAHNITMDRDELIEEHENLIKVLKNGSKKKRKKEAKKQEKELKEYKNETFEKGNRKKPMDYKQRKIRKIMKEFRNGTLMSSAGTKVTNEEQALAIALSEAKRMMSYKACNDQLGHFIDIEKAHVKAHMTKTKTGKVVQVRDYTNKVNKKNAMKPTAKKVAKKKEILETKKPDKNNIVSKKPEKNVVSKDKKKVMSKKEKNVDKKEVGKKEKVLFKTKAEYEKMNQEKQNNNVAQQQEQQDPVALKMKKLDKEKQQLDYIADKFPDVVDKKALKTRQKQVVKTKKKIEKLLTEQTEQRENIIKNTFEYKKKDEEKANKQKEIFEKYKDYLDTIDTHTTNKKKLSLLLDKYEVKFEDNVLSFPTKHKDELIGKINKILGDKFSVKEQEPEKKKKKFSFIKIIKNAIKKIKDKTKKILGKKGKDHFSLKLTKEEKKILNKKDKEHFSLDLTEKEKKILNKKNEIKKASDDELGYYISI